MPLEYLKLKYQIKNHMLSGAQKDLDCSCQTGSSCLINRYEAMSMTDCLEREREEMAWRNFSFNG